MKPKFYLLLLFLIATSIYATPGTAQTCLADGGVLPPLERPLTYEIATLQTPFASMAAQDGAATAALDTGGTTIPYATLKEAYAAATAAVAGGATGNDILIAFRGGRYTTDNTVFMPFDINITDPTMGGLVINAYTPALIDMMQAGFNAFIDITGVDNIIINGVSTQGFSETDGSVYAITDAQDILISNSVIFDNTGGSAVVIESTSRDTRVRFVDCELNDHADFPSETAMSIKSSSANGAVNTYVDFVNTSFSCNTRDKFGGALDITNPRSSSGPGPVVEFFGGFFHGNSGTGGAADGGAVYIGGNATVTFNKTNFYDNISESGTGTAGGGAIAIDGESTVTINSGQFENNSSFQYGGAILISENSNIVNITNSVFKGNSGLRGAAIDIDGGNFTHSQVTIDRCLFYENNVTGTNSTRHHGTIFIDAEASGAGSAVNTTISRSTIANNLRGSTSGTETAGIYMYGSRNNVDTDPDSDVLTIENCIFWGNTGKDLQEVIIAGFLEDETSSVSLQGTNTIEDGTSNKGDLFTQGTDPVFADPSGDFYFPTGVTAGGYRGKRYVSQNPGVCPLIPVGDEPCPKVFAAVLPAVDFEPAVQQVQVYVAFDGAKKVRQVAANGLFALGSKQKKSSQSGKNLLHEEEFTVYAVNYDQEEFVGTTPFQALTATPRNLDDFLTLSSGGSSCINLSNPVTLNVASCCEYDNDRDGICDDIDIDDDNDGIPDVIELGCASGSLMSACQIDDPLGDMNNNGIVNYMDPTYCTLNAAGVCAFMDQDIDGIPNFLDLDSDNDGIPDVIEAGGEDVDGNGHVGVYIAVDVDQDGLGDLVDISIGTFATSTALPIFNTDGIGQADYLDLDSDNDGIPDLVEVSVLTLSDANHDGMVDDFEPTSIGTFDPFDHDGWSPLYDGDSENNYTINTSVAQLVHLSLGDLAINIDQTTLPNHLDLDADGDGIVDIIEAGGEDADGNGQTDEVADLNDNGWADNHEGVGLPIFNTDGYGAPDYADIDSDDDGITDNVEGQSTNGKNLAGTDDGTGGFRMIEDLDDDNDGIDNAYDNNRFGYGGSGISKNVPMGARIGAHDFDGDDKPDYIDEDADNDGTLDRIEGHDLDYDGFANNNLPCVVDADQSVPLLDTDKDGLLDCYDDPTPSPDPRRVGVATGNCPTPLGAGCTPEENNANVTDVDSQPDFRDKLTNYGVPLPLQLISFSVSSEDCAVSLEWITDLEENVAYFSLEKSTDGQRYSSIHQQAAKGNTNSETLYQYTDPRPDYNQYYRLKIVDIDGSFVYSDIVSLKYDCYKTATIAAVYPVPAKGQLTFDYFTEASGEGRAIVVDLLGKELLRQDFSFEKGLTTQEIDINGLAVGVYFLSIEMEDKLSEPVRFVKIK